MTCPPLPIKWHIKWHLVTVSWSFLHPSIHSMTMYDSILSPYSRWTGSSGIQTALLKMNQWNCVAKSTNVPRSLSVQISSLALQFPQESLSRSHLTAWILLLASLEIPRDSIENESWGKSTLLSLLMTWLCPSILEHGRSVWQPSLLWIPKTIGFCMTLPWWVSKWKQARERLAQWKTSLWLREDLPNLRPIHVDKCG